MHHLFVDNPRGTPNGEAQAIVGVGEGRAIGRVNYRVPALKHEEGSLPHITLLRNVMAVCTSILNKKDHSMSGQSGNSRKVVDIHYVR